MTLTPSPIFIVNVLVPYFIRRKSRTYALLKNLSFERQSLRWMVALTPSPMFIVNVLARYFIILVRKSRTYACLKMHLYACERRDLT